jgi:hypothetical protein
MNIYEKFACGQIFCTYPENKSFDEIIDLCEHDELREAFNDALEDTENEDQQLILCERYENEWWENIPTLLIELATAFEFHFKK